MPKKWDIGKSGEENDVADGCGLGFALSDADGALGCASYENIAKNVTCAPSDFRRL